MVCPHSISVSAVINYTNIGSYKPCEARLFKVKSEFFAEFGRFNNAKLVLYQPLLRKQINSGIQLEMARVEGFP